MEMATYETLEEEFEATFPEMSSVGIQCGDEVLYWDINGDNDVHIGIVLDIEHFHGNFYEPPSNFYEIQKDDGTTEEGFEDEYIMKRKTQGVMA